MSLDLWMSPRELPRACRQQLRVLLLVYLASGPQVPRLPLRACSRRTNRGERFSILGRRLGSARLPEHSSCCGIQGWSEETAHSFSQQNPWDRCSACLRHPDKIMNTDQVLVAAGHPFPVTRPSPPRALVASNQDKLPVAGTASGHAGPPWERTVPGQAVRAQR